MLSQRAHIDLQHSTDSALQDCNCRQKPFQGLNITSPHIYIITNNVTTL